MNFFIFFCRQMSQMLKSDILTIMKGSERMNRFLITVVYVIIMGIGCSTPTPPPVEYSTPASASVQIPDELRSPAGDKRLVAIVGMQNKSIFRAEQLWDMSSDLLTTRLVEIGYFRVIDWQRMKSQFDSVSLQTASLVSTPGSLVNVRDRLSCDYFLGGAITFYDVAQTGEVSAMSKNKTITTTVRVDLWLQHAQTGEYLSAASGNGQAKQQFSGGLMGGVIGTWDFNIANKALTLAIDDALIKLLKTYQQREKQSVAASYTPNMPQQFAPSSIVDPSKFARKGNKWAMIVGVARFADPVISPLNYSDQDAMAMYHYLVDPNQGNFPKEQVFLVVNDQATTLRMKNIIEIISKQAQPQDTVLFFVSTHGTPASYDVEGVGYLATFDTLTHSLYSTAFSMSDLVRAVQNRIRANTVVTLMDACYSAGALNGTAYFTKGSKDLVIESEPGNLPSKMVENKMDGKAVGISKATAQALSSGKGRIFITSSQNNEKSWESDNLKQGYFTYYLIDGLKKKGGKVRQAYEYMKNVMPNEVMKDKKHPQNPVMSSGEIAEDIVLISNTQP